MAVWLIEKGRAWILHLSVDFTFTTTGMKTICYHLAIYKCNFSTALVFSESEWQLPPSLNSNIHSVYVIVKYSAIERGTFIMFSGLSILICQVFFLTFILFYCQ